MAEPDNQKKRPRIRKTAPTVRERVAAAQAEAEKPAKPQRIRNTVGKAKAPIKKLKPSVRVHFPDNSFFRILGKVLGWLAPTYFVNSWREVRQVTWPARRETWRLTLAVFIFALIFGSMVYGVDKGLDELFKKFVLK